MAIYGTKRNDLIDSTGVWTWNPQLQIWQLTSAYGTSGGNDVVYAGNGDDTVYGGAGDDNLNGDNGKDSLYGEAGNDTLSGGNGEDILDGGKDNDTLYGGNGDDTLNGGVSELVLGPLGPRFQVNSTETYGQNAPDSAQLTGG